MVEHKASLEDVFVRLTQSLSPLDGEETSAVTEAAEDVESVEDTESDLGNDDEEVS
jgi:hypothetical protein